MSVNIISRMMILDGGMGHQLKSMGVKIEGPVGSMRRFLGVCMANVEQPNLVTAAHLEFIDAGASIITTNSYAVCGAKLFCCNTMMAPLEPSIIHQFHAAGLSIRVDRHDELVRYFNLNLSVFFQCTPRHLALVEKAGERTLEKHDLESFLKAAGERATEAKNLRPQRGVKVAGCLPPLRDSYRHDLVGSFDEILPDYQRIARGIAPYSDLLLCETMSTAEEARAACTAAAETGAPVYMYLPSSRA